jgi:hypothetical protein
MKDVVSNRWQIEFERDNVVHRVVVATWKSSHCQHQFLCPRNNNTPTENESFWLELIGGPWSVLSSFLSWERGYVFILIRNFEKKSSRKWEQKTLRPQEWYKKRVKERRRIQAEEKANDWKKKRPSKNQILMNWKSKNTKITRNNYSQ